MLRSAANIENDPGRLAVFTNAQDRIIPDPLVYSQWFRKADERKRRIAVGSRRYSALKSALGRSPAWEEFLDPKSGDLASLDRLQSETPRQREIRVAKARELLNARKAGLKRVTVRGY